MSGRRILVMAGGTGGHIYPALAVARWLRAAGVSVHWLGTRKGLESELVPQEGFPIQYIEISGLRGKGPTGWFLAPIRLVRALLQTIAAFRRLRPDAVLGFGGFVTGPGGVAAWLLRKPLIIHEQNAVAGLTNRWLSYLAGCVLEAFPGTFPPSRRAVATGNPVRREIAELPDPELRYAGRNGALRLLVIGGSLGAAALNERIPEALAALEPDLRPVVRHQTGRRHLRDVEQRYVRAGVQADVEPFIERMDEALAWADVAICRAGALTVSELAAAGLPAVLVPFPFAVDDHQTRNAEYLARSGGALLVQQSELDCRRIEALLRDFAAGGRERLLPMAEAARALARPEATRVVAEQCLKQVGAMGIVPKGKQV